MSKRTISIISIVGILVLFDVAGYFILRNDPINEERLIQAFSSQAECEQTTGRSCAFQMCDSIPPGKTFEEVCGKGFKKGWVPDAQRDISCDFNTYRGKGCAEGSVCFAGVDRPCGPPMSPSDTCIQDAVPVGDNLCHQECSSDRDCDSGFSCEYRESYSGDVQMVAQKICVGTQ